MINICTPLSILFRKSLQEGAHDSWKKAIIAALYKKGKKSDPSNYRPVSLTSVISKIMEFIVRDANGGPLNEKQLVCKTLVLFLEGNASLDEND